MATAENRELIGLGYPVTADPMTCDGGQWIAANFNAAKRWRESKGTSEFDPDPPGAPNRGYRGTTEFGTPTFRASRNPQPRRTG
jgi:hypothetical protein